MKFRYFNDGKHKIQSHELELEFDFNELQVYGESKESCVEQMKQAVSELIENLQKIEWDKV